MTRQKSTIVFMLLMPLLFTLGIGWASSGDDDVSQPLHVLVTNEDAGVVGDALIAHLDASKTVTVERVSSEATASGADTVDAGARIVIPVDFTERLRAGEPVTLDVQPADGIGRWQRQRLEHALATASTELAGSLDAVVVTNQLTDTAGEQGRFAQIFAAAERRWQSGRPIALHVSEEGGAGAAPSGFNQASPGMLTMFAMFLFLGGGVALVIERTEGTLPRLVTMPIDRSSIIVGKLLGIYVVGLGQMTLLILAGIVFFDVNWGQSPAALALVLLSFALAATGLGIALAAFVKTPAQATAFINIAVMLVSALGGAWWPLEIVPAWMRVLGHAFPTAWAMDAFHIIITRGLGVSAVLQQVAVLLGFAALFVVIGTWRFEYE